LNCQRIRQIPQLYFTTLQTLFFSPIYPAILRNKALAYYKGAEELDFSPVCHSPINLPLSLHHDTHTPFGRPNCVYPGPLVLIMSRIRGFLTPSGEWQCDCSPRMPAIWLEVKKNNQNKVVPTLISLLTTGTTFLYMPEATRGEVWLLFVGY